MQSPTLCMCMSYTQILNKLNTPLGKKGGTGGSDQVPLVITGLSDTLVTLNKNLYTASRRCTNGPLLQQSVFLDRTDQLPDRLDLAFPERKVKCHTVTAAVQKKWPSRSIPANPTHTRSTSRRISTVAGFGCRSVPCFHPIRGYRGRSGKVTTKLRDALSLDIVYTRCGQCGDCRRARCLDWAARIMNEAECHTSSSFITLTFKENPEVLENRTFQLFMKRFRKQLTQKIRFFACGEYGDKLSRPHWHAIIFGWEPSHEDTFETSNGHYSSHVLHSSWNLGYTDVGSLTPASASYVAQYSQKKLTGSLGDNFYSHPETGEISPPRAIMSRKPGIGSEWYKIYGGDIWETDSIYFSRGTVRPPKYYFEKLKLENPALAEEISRARQDGHDDAEFERLVLDGVAERFAKSRDNANDKRHKEL